MSTKIYNGFRLPGTLDDAFRALNTPENREAVQAIVKDEILKYTSHLIARRIDRAHLYPDDEKIVGEAKHVTFEAHRQLRDDQKKIKTEGHRNPLVDFELEVSLIPTSGCVLGIAYMDNNTLRDWFFALESVEDYSYWNNSDPPEGMPEQEWAEREAAWENVLPVGRTPAELGVTLQLSPSPDFGALPFRRDEYRPYFKPVSKRARGHAQDYILTMKMRALEAEAGFAGANISDWSRRYTAADRFLRTDDGKAMLDRLAAEYEPRLPDLTTVEF